MNMQTRAENLNGSFDVETDLGMGCKIWVCCLVKMIRVGRQCIDEEVGSRIPLVSPFLVLFIFLLCFISALSFQKNEREESCFTVIILIG